MMRIERSEIRVISVGGMEVCLRGVAEVLGRCWGGVSGCRGGVREVCRGGVGEVLGMCVGGVGEVCLGVSGRCVGGCRGSVLGMG